MWSEQEEKMLIAIYFDKKIQDMLDGTCRNTQVYQKISDMLAAEAVFKTPKDCKVKINNLKTWYKKQVDRVGKPGPSGGARPKRPAIFDLLNEFLGERPSTKPPVVVESGDISADSDDSELGGLDSQVSDTEPTADASPESMESEASSVSTSTSRSSTSVTTSAASMATNTPSTSTRKDANGVTASKRPPSTSSSVGHSSSDSDDSDSPSAKGKSLKKGKARRKVPKYEKAMRSVKSGISGVQAEADARLEEAIRESLRSQQEWEERQREKELLAMQKFQADMLAAERESMNQLGAIMTSIFGSQQQTAFHQTRPLQRTAAPFNSQTQPLQHNAASYNSQPTSIQYGAPHPAQYETPRRVVPAQTRRLQESTEFSSLLSDTTDVLNL